MLKIAVCDDEMAACVQVQCALAEILGREKVKYTIDLYDSAEALCSKMDGGRGRTEFDLIFLDIEFSKNEIDGVQAGLRIRNAYQNNAVSIVYISWEKDHAFDASYARPMRFLPKPLKAQEIEETVKIYLSLRNWKIITCE